MYKAIRKTKIALPLIAFVIFGISASAQKEILTKEETINYLSKKAQELDGRYLFADDIKCSYSQLSVLLKGDDVEFKYTETRSNGQTLYVTYLFNPVHISAINIQSPAKSDDLVQEIFITFPAKTARKKVLFAGGDPYKILVDVNLIRYHFFASTRDSYSRIIKALNHLRDLAKAEEDPFGN